MKTYTISALVLGVSIALVSCGSKNGGKDKTSQKPSEPAIDSTLLDAKVLPVNDFFDHVNNLWVAKNPIPSTESNWGSFNLLRDQSKATLKDILEKAAANKDAAKGSNSYMLGVFYRTGMDSTAIDKEGVKPLAPWFAMIDAAKTPAETAKLYAELTKVGGTTPLSVFVEQDFKNTTQYILYIYQGGLGLPEKEYYFRTDEESKKNREEYKKHIAAVLKLSGVPEAETTKKAEQIFALETDLAKASMDIVEMRDPYKTYNPVTLEELKKMTPGFDWDSYFKELGLANVPANLVLGQPEFLKTWGQKLLTKTTPETWKDYFKYHLVNSHAAYLGNALEDENFNFYGKILEGKTTKDPRWKRMSSMADNMLRDVLGQEYVKVAFDEKAKSRADELIKNLMSALEERINNLSWMSKETKVKAQEKLSKISVKIGYPEKWRSYEGLQLTDQPFVLNVIACNAYEYKRNLDKLGKPIDRTEWHMGPQTVNAYYNPLMNEIVFPAAILQPPFFNANADDAVNYGGIGMVIGHELTHGFDDQGRQFDADGNLKDWWTEEDGKNFKKLADNFVKQYNAYEPLDSLHVNGELTLGENIADLGGIIIAYSAFKKTKQGQGNEKINGLTPDQRFFINYAQIWRGHAKPEYLRQQVFTDPHSPRKFRVNGVLYNFEPFYEAFGVKENNGMYVPKDQRSVMW